MDGPPPGKMPRLPETPAHQTEQEKAQVAKVFQEQMRRRLARAAYDQRMTPLPGQQAPQPGPAQAPRKPAEAPSPVPGNFFELKNSKWWGQYAMWVSNRGKDEGVRRRIRFLNVVEDYKKNPSAENADSIIEQFFTSSQPVPIDSRIVKAILSDRSSRGAPSDLFDPACDHIMNLESQHWLEERDGFIQYVNRFGQA